ncbi:IS3 family transposase [Streptomyces bacillaris]|uniref:IS3 family transposase n=1 Tax=Streptomyces bacillaris TaxID=68179 RepID=UPI0037FCEE0A
MKPLVRQIFEANYRVVYGARKICREPHRRGSIVARCTVERLMRELGIVGAVRGKKVITTIPDSCAERALDLLDRNFVASAGRGQQHHRAPISHRTRAAPATICKRRGTVPETGQQSAQTPLQYKGNGAPRALGDSGLSTPDRPAQGPVSATQL